MNKRLVHVAPLQCGTVIAALYFCLSLLLVPIMLLPMMFAMHHPAARPPFPFGTVIVVLFPFIYGLLGFIFGIIAALVYNLIAKMTGGLEFRVIDVPPGTPAALDPVL